MDLRISLLIFNFATIYIIHKNLALIKSHLNYLKDRFSNSFLRSITHFYFFKK